MTEDLELEALADEFSQWASDEDILSFDYTPDNRRSSPSQKLDRSEPRLASPAIREDRTVAEERAGFSGGILQRELGQALDAIRRTFENDPIHFVGTSPRPRRLLIAHIKRKTSGDERLPARTASGIRIEYVGGKVPEIRLASAAISAAKTQVLVGGRYPCGSSISIGNIIGAGTLTALVEDDDGKLLGLSCNHVTGLCNNTAREMPIVAPGILDVPPRSLDPRWVITRKSPRLPSARQRTSISARTWMRLYSRSPIVSPSLDAAEILRYADEHSQLCRADNGREGWAHHRPYTWTAGGRQQAHSTRSDGCGRAEGHDPLQKDHAGAQHAWRIRG